jgi:rhodanese-related sulfurtransferase
MKTFFRFLLMLLMVSGSTVLAQTGRLNVNQFSEKVQAANTIIVDIRTASEFKSGTIPGAVNIDFYQPDFKQRINLLDKKKNLLIYCASGNRSGQALPLVGSLGFKSVNDLQGGITAWKNAGKKIKMP